MGERWNNTALMLKFRQPHSHRHDGSNMVCVDYRQLNKMVLKDCFPVPIVENVLEKLEIAKMFTIMDLENGFSHVRVG